MYTAFNTAARQQPDEAAALGLLQHLSKDELQELMDNDAKLSGLIIDLPQVKNLQDDKEACLTANKSLAEYNLSKEPVLAQLKTTLARTYTSAKQLNEDFQSKVQKLNEVGGSQLSVDTALALLQTESARSEELAEETANEFLEGNVEVDQFLETFIKQSSKAHRQKVKTEKLQAIATRLRQGLPAQAPPLKTPPPSQPKNNFYSGGGLQWRSSGYSPGGGGYGNVPNSPIYFPS